MHGKEKKRIIVDHRSWDSASDKEDRGMLFIEHFRMMLAVFHDLCEKLPPYIQRQDIRRRPVVSAKLKVAVAFYKVALFTNLLTNKPTRRYRFHLVLPEAHHSIYGRRLTGLFCEQLQPKIIKFPAGQSLTNIMMSDFEGKKRMPTCVGVVDRPNSDALALTGSFGLPQ